MYIDSDRLKDCCFHLNASSKNMRDAFNELSNVNFPSNSKNYATYIDKKRVLLELFFSIQNSADSLKHEIEDKIEAFNGSEEKNREIADSIKNTSENQNIPQDVKSENSNSTDVSSNSSSKSNSSSNNRSSTNRVRTAVPDNNNGLNDAQTPDFTAADVEVKAATDTEAQMQSLNSQVNAVISFLFGNYSNLTDEEKQKITTGITIINNTGLLDGLDEDRTNIIRAQIIKDFLDGKLELDETLTKEKLQEYIDSQPNIKIKLEIAIAINYLVKDCNLTKEEVEEFINTKIKICESEEEFQEVYKKSGETEDISKMDWLSINGKIYIPNTANSATISAMIHMVITYYTPNNKNSSINNTKEIDHAKISESIKNTDNNIKNTSSTVKEVDNTRISKSIPNTDNNIKNASSTVKEVNNPTTSTSEKTVINNISDENTSSKTASTSINDKT